jgi:hypothetical protein
VAEASKVTPNFWDVLPANKYRQVKIITSVCGQPNAGADAKLIVRAVNAYDALVDALKGVVAMVDAAGGPVKLSRAINYGSQTSWAVKMDDAIIAARAALEAACGN